MFKTLGSRNTEIVDSDDTISYKRNHAIYSEATDTKYEIRTEAIVIKGSRTILCKSWLDDVLFSESSRYRSKYWQQVPFGVFDVECALDLMFIGLQNRVYVLDIKEQGKKTVLGRIQSVRDLHKDVLGVQRSVQAMYPSEYNSRIKVQCETKYLHLLCELFKRTIGTNDSVHIVNYHGKYSDVVIRFEGE